MSNTINFQANVVNLIKFTPIHKKKLNVPKFPLALSFIDKNYIPRSIYSNIY